MRVLIIEDNMYVARALALVLRRHYQVDVVRTGADGLEAARVHIFDIVLLDLGLPDMSGLDVITKLRLAKCVMPIMVLTGLGGSLHKVKALDIGADDYVTKPFELEELTARMRALLRRGARHNLSRVLRHRSVALDVEARTVHVGHALIQTRRREFDVLEYLLRNQGRVLTRQMIFDHVWDTHAERWSNVVDSQIRALRYKIDRPYNITLISTRYGLGYVIELPEVPQSQRRPKRLGPDRYRH